MSSKNYDDEDDKKGKPLQKKSGTKAYSKLIYKVEHRLSGRVKFYYGEDARFIHDKTTVG